jgi:hypothetical protein
MIPKTENPTVVIRITSDGVLVTDRNNIGDDLAIVVARTDEEFAEKSAGIPYSGTDPGPGQTKVLAMKKK